jgi:hypothetical protein
MCGLRPRRIAAPQQDERESKQASREAYDTAAGSCLALVGVAALRRAHGYGHRDAGAFGLWRIQQTFEFLKQFTQASAQLVQRALFLLCHSIRLSTAKGNKKSLRSGDIKG